MAKGMDGRAPTCARGAPSPTFGIPLGDLPYLSAPWFSHPVMDGTIYLRRPETAAGTCSERQLAGKPQWGPCWVGPADDRFSGKNARYVSLSFHLWEN